MISPTTFFTGSAILVGLFFYDIYMVFFTPLMVTVATKLDVPIKLMFPKPGGRNTAAMLGLGDIVIPGLMVGLALRFDLYLFYLRRQKRVSAKTGESGGDEETVVKAEYYPLAGRWSDHFWTHSFMGRPLWSSTSPTGAASRTHQGGEGNEEAPFTFPKVYFNAALIGYVGGLVATLCALHLMNHAQPALLWLVPGVLISLWSTALVRGELGLMWNYSEEIVEEEGDADGKGEKKRTPEQGSTSGDKHDRKDEKAEKRAKTRSRRSDRELLSFSIEAPRKPRRTAASIESDDVEVERNGTMVTAQSVGNGTFWAGSTSNTTARQEVDTEPAGKRLRVR
jgi:minor histocompatibility antigen H13